ncbi:MAG: DUF2291 family protein [Burkholderiaceae bacterium]|nr:DUF2291 family protein [Microbacteriaceae bacterium]
MSTITGSQRRRTVRAVIVVAALALLVVLMALNTRFLTAEEATAAAPAKFDAAVYAADELPGITQTVQADATDLAEVVSAVTTDAAAAGEKYGHLAGTDKYAIPVSFTGTVSAADANFLTVTVPGLAPEASVRIPLTQAVNGTAIRDVTGETKFADFANQTDYQQAANEFKNLITAQVIGSIDAAASVGTTLTVDGVFVTNSGPDSTYIVTPVAISSGS